MSKFKVGDRVRVKDPDWFQNFDAGNDLLMLSSSDEFKVVGFNTSWQDEEFVEVAYSFIRLEYTDDELELVDNESEESSQISADPKTAFLAELKELLIRHNASIEITEDFPDCSYIKFNIGVESVSYENIGLTEVGGVKREIITADNINDYDKEGI